MIALALRSVSRSFGGLRAVSSVSFDVSRNSIVGLIGPNGAGKTTLFNLISGNSPPDEGQVTLFGEDITGLPSYAIARKGVGRTFQIMKPFGRMTVLDNVTSAALTRTNNVHSAIDFARRTVARTGLERYASQQAGLLPTAARKRLELARAMALQPSVLLLDEVLAGLVPAERAPVIELLENLRAEGLTLLMVEHVMAAVMRLCDRVVVLHHGEKIAEGTPEEVTRDARVVEAYLGASYALA